MKSEKIITVKIHLLYSLVAFITGFTNNCIQEKSLHISRKNRNSRSFMKIQTGRETYMNKSKYRSILKETEVDKSFNYKNCRCKSNMGTWFLYLCQSLYSPEFCFKRFVFFITQLQLLFWRFIFLFFFVFFLVENNENTSKSNIIMPQIRS